MRSEDERGPQAGNLVKEACAFALEFIQALGEHMRRVSARPQGCGRPETVSGACADCKSVLRAGAPYTT